MGTKQPFDSFLPSGALGDAKPPNFGSTDSMTPRTLLPEYIPQPLQGDTLSSPPNPYPHSQSVSYFHSEIGRLSPNPTSQTLNGPPISPPVSRSASSDGGSTAQVEYWRLHARKIRDQAQGERAHMLADRARADEVMEEERALWDEERQVLKSRIAELEAQLEAVVGTRSPFNLPNRNVISFSPTNRSRGGTPQGAPQRSPPQVITTSSYVSGSINGTEAKVVPQESGRNPDGTAFYAPAPRNPRRTFDHSESNNLRVDNMSAPRETPLRVTSKELTASDFAVNSPPAEDSSHEGSVIGEGSIDISCIQPELEGISLKASAVAPEFVAKVMSPSMSMSPTKTPSSNVVSPPQPRDITNSQDGVQQNSSQTRKTTTLEVIAAPENHRLTMHAGHTPNHSITKFDLGESGGITPTQTLKHERTMSMAEERPEQDDVAYDEDPELKGPLGLSNDIPKDIMFLEALTNKLEEVKKSGQLSPSVTSVSSDDLKAAVNSYLPSVGTKDSAVNEDDDPAERTIDEAPRLRVKASTNFGKPFGTL
jgi:hypothetical protein